MMDLTHYNLEDLRADDNFILYRLLGKDGAASRLALVPRHPSLAALEKLEHEFAIARDLDPGWAVIPVELMPNRESMMLLLEDPGGRALSVDRALTLDQRLSLAVDLARTVRNLHRCGLLHRDINPANFLIAEDGVPRLTGFGCAVRGKSIGPPSAAITGTLAYIAPEQTGRVDCAIDHRSDLYMLGVTLYELFTGALPFSAETPGEWVHSHIARAPAPLGEHSAHLPPQLSDIILKTLSKNPAARYQSASGLAADLETCLAAWTTRQRIETFPLGRRDETLSLQLASTLVGRECEIASLTQVFDSVVAEGQGAVTLVSGPSGIGKSALVREFLSKLRPEDGLVATGKSDRRAGGRPYAALSQAFASIVRQILGQEDDRIAAWKRVIAGAIAPNGDLIAEVVPEIALLLGPQPSHPDPSPTDRAGRLRLAFQQLTEVFGSRGRPLVLFIDDLQWLDTASLEIVANLVGRDRSNLMFIGACRAEETGVARESIWRLRSVRLLEEIALRALTPGDIAVLIAGGLGGTSSRVQPLADLVHAKTGGNPFFARQFLGALHEEGLLDYDADAAVWKWDLTLARTRGFTENVADFMATKLDKLGAETRRVLQTLAALGTDVGLDDLATATGLRGPEVEAGLRPALRADLIFKSGTGYVFAHDRVQEAAYALVSPEDRPARHLVIGMALTEGQKAKDLGENLYLAAAQLDRGSAAAASDDQRERIVVVNLQAGRRARDATAYEAAIGYLEVACAMIGDQAHWCDTETVFAVALLRAECEFLIGRLDAAESRLLALSRTCPDIAAAADVARLRTSMFTIRGELDRGIEVGLAFLREAGIDWNPDRSGAAADREGALLLAAARALSDEQLRALPPTSDAAHRAISAVLADLIPPAVLANGDLADVVRLGAARLTLEHGICAQSSYLFAAAFEAISVRCNDPELGFRLAKLGADLADSQPDLPISGRTLMVFGHLVSPWFQSIRLGRPVLLRAREYALALGDLAFVAYADRGLVSERLFCGAPLAEVHADAVKAVAFTDAIRFSMPGEALAIQRDLAAALMGDGGEAFSIGEGGDACPAGAARKEQNRFATGKTGSPRPCETTQPIIAFFDYAARVQLNVLAGRHEAALIAARSAQTLSWVAGNYPELVEYHFYSALAHAAARDADPSADAHCAGLRSHFAWLESHCARVPENFGCRVTLLAAELARGESRPLDAEHLYEESIRKAREAGFVQIEAIAAERAAGFYRARGIDTVVGSYLENARHCYARWGARAKLDQLQRSFSNLTREQRAAGTAGELSPDRLDMLALFKASRALSEGMTTETVIRTLLRVLIENAAVDRGILFHVDEGGPRAVAEGRLRPVGIDVKLWDADLPEVDFAKSIVNYVARTRTAVWPGDPTTADLSRVDSYTRRHRDISIHCLPIVGQTRLVGILYLESAFAERAVTRQQTLVLDLLAAQAAISLENARLYTDLQRSEAFLAEGQKLSRSGSWSWQLSTGKIGSSREFRSVFGLDPDCEAPTFLCIARMIHPEDRSDVARTVRRSIQGGLPFDCAFRLGRGDAEQHLQAVGRPERDEVGHLSGFVGTVIDVTAFRQAQEALQSAQSDLAHAARLAAIGELSGMIAHEVRQPLTAIAAQASASRSWLAHRPPDIAEANSAAERIASHAHRASDILESIRNMTRKAPLSKVAVDVNAVIAETTELLSGELRRQSIALNTKLATDLEPVLADRIQLQQVLMNLMMNGIEAMAAIEDRPRMLTIETLGDTSAVVISVADVGIGLPADDRRLFDAFFTTKPHGLGIGLAISRSIVEQHGGNLRALPNAPHGSVFRFSVPLVSS